MEGVDIIRKMLTRVLEFKGSFGLKIADPWFKKDVKLVTYISGGQRSITYFGQKGGEKYEGNLRLKQ